MAPLDCPGRGSTLLLAQELANNPGQRRVLLKLQPIPLASSKVAAETNVQGHFTRVHVRLKEAILQRGGSRIHIPEANLALPESRISLLLHFRSSMSKAKETFAHTKIRT